MQQFQLRYKTAFSAWLVRQEQPAAFGQLKLGNQPRQNQRQVTMDHPIHLAQLSHGKKNTLPRTVAYLVPLGFQF
jgi:hypothetical protein